MRITGLSTMILPRAAAAYGTPQATALKPEAQALIAGGVRGAVTFEATGSRTAPNASAAYQLYTRAADKIEAAVGVQIGRQLDVCG